MGASPGLFVLTLIVSVLAGVVVPIQLLLLALTIDAVTSPVGIDNLRAAVDLILPPVAALTATWIVSGITRPSSESLLRLFFVKLQLHVESELLAKASRMDLALFEDQRFYNGLSNAQRDVARIGDMVFGVVGLARDGVTLVSVLALLFSFNPWAVLILSVAIVPELLFQGRFGRKIMETWNSRTPGRRFYKYIASLLAEREAVKEVRGFQLEDSLLSRYRRERLAHHRQDVKLTRWQIRGLGLIGLLSVVGTVVVWAWAAVDAVLGTVSMGTLALVFGAADRARSQLQQVSLAAGVLIQSRLFAQSYFDFMDLDPGAQAGSLQLRPTAQSVPRPLREGVTLTAVGFGYSGQDGKVLHSIDTTIRAGERIAIVGENGAGKTTLVKLLSRLYDPTEGTISLDGTDYRDYDLGELRSAISVVFQDYVSYHLTARENVGFGDVSRLEETEAVMLAAEKMGAKDLIETLPNGLETFSVARWRTGRTSPVDSGRS